MQLESFSLAGKRAFVTGGGTGLGLGITQALVKAGAEVIIAGRRESILKEVAEQIGAGVHFEYFDVTQRADIPAFVKKLEEKYGPIV